MPRNPKQPAHEATADEAPVAEGSEGERPVAEATEGPDPGIGVHEFIGGDHRRAVEVAGLVADAPELAEAQLTADEWQTRLQAWLVSERP